MDGEDKPIGVELDLQIEMEISERQKLNRSQADSKSTDSSNSIDLRVNRSVDGGKHDRGSKAPFS